MGHESQIELWSPNGRPFCFVAFATDRLRRQEAMKTAGRENPNRWAIVPSIPSAWCGRSEQISLDQVGCEARKIPAEGGVFFLDFYLYRTYQELARWHLPEADFWKVSGIPLVRLKLHREVTATVKLAVQKQE